MERDDVAPKHKVYPPVVWRTKISIPAARYRVIRNFSFRPYGPEHRICALKRFLIKILIHPALQDVSTSSSRVAAGNSNLNRLKRDLGSLSIMLAIFFCCMLIDLRRMV